MKHRLDIEKAVEALLYVTNRVRDMYKALKVLYFADKQHLASYGRLIYGDSYVAMRHGPVPSAAYDLLKDARGNGLFRGATKANTCFTIEGHDVVPQREANLDLLSDSDRECIDAAISQYGELPFAELRTLSHKEPAFQGSDENDFIPIESIVASLPDSDLLLSYMRDD